MSTMAAEPAFPATDPNLPLCLYCRARGRHHEDCDGVRLSGPPLVAPPVAEEVPVALRKGKLRTGDSVPGWSCNVLVWTRHREVFAMVYPPHSARSLVTLSLPAGGDKEAAEVGRAALRIAAAAVRLALREDGAQEKMRAVLEDVLPDDRRDRGLETTCGWLRRYQREPRVWAPLDL